MESPVDASRCPLCGGPNDCALADPCRGSACAECWCSHLTIDRDVLARIPKPAVAKACVCRSCATKSSPATDSNR